jgi:hypothetical protein
MQSSCEYPSYSQRCFTAFDPSSGGKDVGVSAKLMRRWEENINILCQVGYSRLLGDAAQFFALVGRYFSWGW